jgi:hypothetical protein
VISWLILVAVLLAVLTARTNFKHPPSIALWSVCVAAFYLMAVGFGVATHGL